MNQPKLLFRAPVLTASGYGVHSRQLLKALLALDAFDIYVLAINWGHTPYLAEGPREPFVKQIRGLMGKHDEFQRAGGKYDVSIQVTIPNEFERIAPLNIGVTAGIEVDRCSPEWIQKCNDNVDVVVVPSQHSAKSLAGVSYKDDKGNMLRLTKPCLIAAEGVDTRFFNTDPIPENRYIFDAPFNFLSVGLGFDKGFGEDRKNLSTLVRWFCERFKDDPNVGLVLKCSMVGNSLLDFSTIKHKIEEQKKAAGCTVFPRIHLVHGRLTEAELANLYKHHNVKAYVTLSHGEGFGLPVLEAAACGLPILATDWSGYLDFLQIDGKKKFVPLDFELKDIPNSVHWKGVMEPGTKWANVKEEDVKTKLKKITLSYDKPKEWAMELAAKIKETHSVEKTSFDFARTILNIVNQFTNNHPKSAAASADRLRQDLKIHPGEKTLIYTMPMSAGDVYISTAVVDSLKKKFPDHKLFFATDPKYFPILKDNPNIDVAIPLAPWMTNVPFMETVFSEVYTPNLAIQTTSANWVHGGKGRLLGNEMAHQCDVDFGEYFIKCDPVELPEMAPDYIAFHPGSGKGQHEARNYLHWQEVVNNLKNLSKLPIVQIGQPDEPLYEGVIDMRGKTTYNQLATVVQNAKVLVGIDTVSMHLAAGLGTPHLAIFGSSYSTSTGPVEKKGALRVLIDTPDRYTCDKACYKYTCAVDKDHPCINEIQPRQIVAQALELLGSFRKDGAEWTAESLKTVMSQYKEFRPNLIGYTTILNGVENEFPFEESVRSMLGFCDQVVVVDGGSTDGTVEKLKAIGATADGRLTVLDHKWDWNEPGMDGMQKAFARAMAPAGPGDFLWQQDADEVVHEEDYQKIRDLLKRFPLNVDIMDLPVVELFGGSDRVRTDRHSWKWRLSRNNFRVTHGINKDARVLDEKTGKTFAKKGQSDGCEYVDIMTGEFLPHKNFYSQELENLRKSDPQAYGREMNRIFGQLPSVFHYSWASLPRKVRNFRDFWNRCWSNLYNDPAPVERFPEAKTLEGFNAVVAKLDAQGGEHGPAQTFRLERSNPAVMGDWLGKQGVLPSEPNRGHLHHDDGQPRSSRASEALAGVAAR